MSDILLAYNRPIACVYVAFLSLYISQILYVSRGVSVGVITKFYVIDLTTEHNFDFGEDFLHQYFEKVEGDRRPCSLAYPGHHTVAECRNNL